MPSYGKLPGKPDVAVLSLKRAIFLDGDLWHGWQFPKWRDKLPSRYWKEKIERNRTRDRKNSFYLRKTGWKVLRIWEHDFKKNSDQALKKMLKFIDAKH